MKKKPSFIAYVLTFFVVVVLYALSWGITCGILYLTALCFGVGFQLKIATGIWLLLILLKMIFRTSKSKK